MNRKSVSFFFKFIVLCTIVLFFAINWPKEIVEPEPPKISSQPLIVPEYTSIFEIPIEVDLFKLQEELEKLIPKTFSGEFGVDIPLLTRERLAYQARRSSARTKTSEDRLILQTDFSGQAILRARLLFPARKTVNFSGSIRILPSNVYIGADWRINSDIDIKYDFRKVSTSILGKEVSIYRWLRNPIANAIPNLEKKIQKIINNFDLREVAENKWDQIDPVFQVARSIWVAINPIGVGLAPLQFGSDRVTTSVLLIANFKTYVGERPDIEKMPLPKIVSTIGSNQFRLYVPVLIPLDSIANTLNEKRKSYVVNIDDKRQVIFSDFDLKEGGGRLVIKARFKVDGLGSPKGTIYLTGYPDMQETTLRFNGLEYDISSNRALLDDAADMLKSMVKEQLHDLLTVDLSSYKQKAIEQANVTANALELGEGVNLGVIVDTVDIGEILLGDGQIAIVAQVLGTASLQVTNE